MSRRLRYGKGLGSIEISGTQKALIEEALRDVAPMTMKILEDEIDKRVEFAKKEWIVRKKNSKGSNNKFDTGIRILQGGKEIEGFFANNAPYAYMIKVADHSVKKNGQKTIVPVGELLAEVAMWDAPKKDIDSVVKKLADAYITDQRKVK